MASLDGKIAAIAERQHGVFTRAQALAAGLTSRQIDGRLEREVWVRVHRAVFRLRGATEPFESRVAAGVLAVGSGACASHATAGSLWRLEAIEPDAMEVSIQGRRRAEVPGVRVHLPRTLTRRDVTKLGCIPITTPVRTLIDLAGSLEGAALEDALDDALRRGLVTVASMRHRLERTANNGRRGIVSLRGLVDTRAGRRVSGSGFENRVLRLLRAGRLPEPVVQHEVYDFGGVFIARVDFAYPHLRLAIEVDGDAWHTSRKARDRDIERQNKLEALGWHVFRIRWTNVEENPDEVVRMVWRCLATLSGDQPHQSPEGPGFGVTNPR